MESKDMFDHSPQEPFDLYTLDVITRLQDEKYLYRRYKSLYNKFMKRKNTPQMKANAQAISMIISENNRRLLHCLERATGHHFPD